jgi:Flp pilus assembly protein TadD
MICWVLVAGWLAGSSICGTKPLLAASATDYLQQGLQDREAGDFPAAIAAMQTAVALKPDYIPGRVNLGWTLHLAGNDRAAADVLQQAAQLDPFYVKTFNALGIVYLVNDDLASAVLAHTWANWLQPDNEIAQYNLSLAYQRLQQYDWAIASAQTAAKLEPDNPHPLVALAIAQWSKGDQQAARTAYQQAIDLDGRYSDRSFLDYLNEAGFSLEQIADSKRVLEAVRGGG